MFKLAYVNIEYKVQTLSVMDEPNINTEVVYSGNNEVYYVEGRIDDENGA